MNSQQLKAGDAYLLSCGPQSELQASLGYAPSRDPRGGSLLPLFAAGVPGAPGFAAMSLHLCLPCVCVPLLLLRHGTLGLGLTSIQICGDPHPNPRPRLSLHADRPSPGEGRLRHHPQT